MIKTRLQKWAWMGKAQNDWVKYRYYELAHHPRIYSY